jgi:hypothetical protein
MIGKRKAEQTEEIVKQGVVAGLLQVVFIFMVSIAFLVFNALFAFGPGKVIIALVSFLIVAVGCVVVTGLLVLGHPIRYAIEKKFNEALLVLAITLGTMFTVLVILALLTIIF